jgi:hypothetical protein
MMALVSKRYNFIFIHIYKCGGNSIRRIFEAPGVGHSRIPYPRGMRELHGVHVDVTDVYNHYKVAQDLTFYNEAVKFAVVRHPFTHLASVYRYVKTSKIHQYHKIMQSKTFFDFLNWYVFEAMTLDRPYGSNKYQLQSDFLSVDGVLQMDHVVKIENMDNDMKDVLNALGMQVMPIPMINRYDDKRRIVWQTYLNAKCRKFVIEHFEKDFDTFGYDKEML